MKRDEGVGVEGDFRVNYNDHVYDKEEREREKKINIRQGILR